MKLPVVNKQAENEQGADSDTETVRKQIAKRDWIGSDGTVVEDEAQATAARYTYIADGQSATFEPKTDDAGTRMLAIFGALTLMGNLTNTWKVEKGDKASSPIDVINERFNLITSGQWIDRTREGVGAKVDPATLAQAWSQVLSAAGKQKDMDDLLAMIEADTLTKSDGTKITGLVASLRRDPKVAAAYATLRGRNVVDATSLLD